MLKEEPPGRLALLLGIGVVLKHHNATPVLIRLFPFFALAVVERIVTVDACASSPSLVKKEAFSFRLDPFGGK